MLLFDAGNSRCKWVWVRDGKWILRGVLDNQDDVSWQELKRRFAAMQAPGKILASNVAGENIRQRLSGLCAVWNLMPAWLVASEAQCGVSSLYAPASSLGSDRWAALIAAWHAERTACLVVNCGTATTIDALSGTGEFIGGLIMPGIALMQQSLAANTAQLQAAQGKVQDFPRNTADAITSGAVRATAGAIAQQLKLLQSYSIARCVVSGGAAEVLMPHLHGDVRYVEDMVLQGLQLIAAGDHSESEIAK